MKVLKFNIFVEILKNLFNIRIKSSKGSYQCYTFAFKICFVRENTFRVIFVDNVLSRKMNIQSRLVVCRVRVILSIYGKESEVIWFITYVMSARSLSKVSENPVRYKFQFRHLVVSLVVRIFIILNWVRVKLSFWIRLVILIVIWNFEIYFGSIWLYQTWEWKFFLIW